MIRRVDRVSAVVVVVIALVIVIRGSVVVGVIMNIPLPSALVHARPPFRLRIRRRERARVRRRRRPRHVLRAEHRFQHAHLLFEK